MNTDEPTDLLSQVREALQASEITKRLGITVHYEPGVVILKGMVFNFYSKQMTQEVIRPALKKFKPHSLLRNEIEVAKG